MQHCANCFFIGNLDQMDNREASANFKESVTLYAVEIFKCYEYQMSRVTSKAGWQVAISEMAKDAVARIFGKLVTIRDEEFSRCKKTFVIFKQNIFMSLLMYSDVVFRSLVEGRSKGFFHKGEELRDIADDDVKLYSGQLYEKPGILLSKGEEGILEAYAKEESDLEVHWYRLAFGYEEEEILGDARRVKHPDLERYKHQVLHWEEEEVNKVVTKVG